MENFVIYESCSVFIKVELMMCWVQVSFNVSLNSILEFWFGNQVFQKGVYLKSYKWRSFENNNLVINLLNSGLSQLSFC